MDDSTIDMFLCMRTGELTADTLSCSQLGGVCSSLCLSTYVTEAEVFNLRPRPVLVNAPNLLIVLLGDFHMSLTEDAVIQSASIPPRFGSFKHIFSRG